MYCKVGGTEEDSLWVCTHTVYTRGGLLRVKALLLCVQLYVYYSKD